jgi:tetrahydromethanopterin S-methyltransferase subunit G
MLKRLERTEKNVDALVSDLKQTTTQHKQLMRKLDKLTDGVYEALNMKTDISYLKESIIITNKELSEVRHRSINNENGLSICVSNSNSINDLKKKLNELENSGIYKDGEKSGIIGTTKMVVGAIWIFLAAMVGWLITIFKG